jgi:Xaa-Pro aminopeptidase
VVQSGVGVTRVQPNAARRREALRAHVRAAGVDALLVTDLVNVRYLTGFTGTNGLAVVGPDTRRFVTDSRYVERARLELTGFDLEPAAQELRAALAAGWPAGSLRLGFEDQNVSVRSHGQLRETLPDRIELVPAGGLVEAERAVKEPSEVDRIRAAAALVDEIYAWLLEQGIVGRTEREVALALEQEMRVRGAEGPSFPSIVAAAENGALPHATPRDVAIAPDTLVTLDIGARLDGYCSDCTRTWATGSLPDDLAELYDTVLRAQEAALDAVRPGPEGREVDAVARDIIAAAGHGDHFGHGLGHGVGMHIHEAPRLARTAEGRLVAGNVVTVEPGIYVPGRGGARIEDLVVVTGDGRDVLSGTPKTLTAVG